MKDLKFNLVESKLGSIRVAIDEQGNSWFCLRDVCECLEINNTSLTRSRLRDGVCTTYPITDTLNRTQEATFVNESGLYDVIFQSRKKEAANFRHWITDEVLPELRKKAGLQAWEAFRMIDKEHQKKCMDLLHEISTVEKKDYIKANTIANKCTSTKFGFDKMVKKEEMDADMLSFREDVLNDTVKLMKFNNDFDLQLSISQTIYKKFNA